MAASVRIGKVAAAGWPAASTAKGRSASSSSVVRIARITATTPGQLISVRLADIRALVGTTSSSTSVRVGDIFAYTATSTLVWNGTAWVAAPPASSAQSVAKGKSTVTGTRSGTSSGSLASIGKGRSTVTAAVTRTGTLALSGTGSLVLGGGTGGANNKSGVTSFSGTGTLSFVGSASQGPVGAGSMSVFPEPDNSPPRMRLVLTGALGPSATIVRVDAQGNTTPVRTANPATLDSGAWTGYDYEAPFNQTVKYVATASLVITSDPFVLTSGQPWLIHPGIPDLSQPLVVQNVPVRARETNQGVHNILGRTTPIVITDGVRRAPTFDLVVRTSTFDALDALDALVDDASVLLLQIAYADIADRQDYDWVAIGAVSHESMTDYYGDPYTQWTLACTVTDYPVGTALADRTLADLAAEFSTLGDLALNFATLGDVITDNLIGS